MIITRRGLIGGLASFLAAPAIVRASSLMPVRPYTSIDLRAGALNWADLGDVTLYRREFDAALEAQYAIMRRLREDVAVITGTMP